MVLLLLFCLVFVDVARSNTCRDITTFQNGPCVPCPSSTTDIVIGMTFQQCCETLHDLSFSAATYTENNCTLYGAISAQMNGNAQCIYKSMETCATTSEPQPTSTHTPTSTSVVVLPQSCTEDNCNCADYGIIDMESCDSKGGDWDQGHSATTIQGTFTEQNSCRIANLICLVPVNGKNSSWDCAAPRLIATTESCPSFVQNFTMCTVMCHKFGFLASHWSDYYCNCRNQQKPQVPHCVSDVTCEANITTTTTITTATTTRDPNYPVESIEACLETSRCPLNCAHYGIYDKESCFQSVGGTNDAIPQFTPASQIVYNYGVATPHGYGTQASCYQAYHRNFDHFNHGMEDSFECYVPLNNRSSIPHNNCDGFTTSDQGVCPEEVISWNTCRDYCQLTGWYLNYSWESYECICSNLQKGHPIKCETTARCDYNQSRGSLTTITETRPTTITTTLSTSTSTITKTTVTTLVSSTSQKSSSSTTNNQWRNTMSSTTTTSTTSSTTTNIEERNSSYSTAMSTASPSSTNTQLATEFSESTKSSEKSDTSTSSAEIIGIVIGIIIAAFVCILVILCLCRRNSNRSNPTHLPGEKQTVLLTNNPLYAREPGNQDVKRHSNPMYASGAPSVSGSNGVYSGYAVSPPTDIDTNYATPSALTENNTVYSGYSASDTRKPAPKDSAGYDVVQGQRAIAQTPSYDVIPENDPHYDLIQAPNQKAQQWSVSQDENC
eukprot:m.6029 g.6029  ORF g.6029 m.6029 type:complete len:723 (+) comp3470_c0_seq1:137-2305(+)